MYFAATSKYMIMGSRFVVGEFISKECGTDWIIMFR